MPIYKMSDKQYRAMRGSRPDGNSTHKHQDVIDECNARMCYPTIKQTQIHLEHNNHTKFVCSVPQMRFITNVITR